MISSGVKWALVLLLICWGSGAARGALTFNLVPAGGMSQQAIDGFQEAADWWSSLLDDSITVKIDINFTTLGAGILGSTGSNSEVYTYSQVAAALTLDATSADDTSAVANLPVGSTLDFRTQDRSGTIELDNETVGSNATNNTYLDINTANAKAIGLTLSDPSASDASITFSDAFTWDFDRSNGITGGSYDFVGVAAHEIGHALGFVSGVDTVDIFTEPNGPNDTVDLNGGQPGIGELDPFAIYNTLDLFRYSSASLLLGADVLDGAYGGTSYFSIDGGATNLARFSTGAFNGNGRQASHWLDNQGLGIMDPTAATGELLNVTTLDLQGFDVIGWDLAATAIPTPAGLTGGLGLLILCATRRNGRIDRQ
ncbi:PEP-CTERM sorting domain-containing protein [Planctomycetales bacterium ZRK34]|nr:PEP-CTERM sorting domain-containing protein [Planctomycetales bacterium ZRK34]